MVSSSAHPYKMSFYSTETADVGGVKSERVLCEVMEEAHVHNEQVSGP